MPKVFQKIWQRKRTLLTLFLVLSAVALSLVWWQVSRMEKDAFRLAGAGRTAIKCLGVLSSALKSGDPELLAGYYDEAYSNPNGGRLVEDLVREEDGVTYYRWHQEAQGHQDKAGVDVAMAELLKRFPMLDFAKFKLANIESAVGEDHITVLATLWLRGKRGDQLIEAKIPFRVAFQRYNLDEWHVIRQDLLGGETVMGHGKGFVDVAAEVGLGEMRNRRNPRFETAEWKPERFPIAQYSSAGVSTADYDGDGWFDLFFPNGAEAHLFRNKGDGTFEDTTLAAGLPADLIGVNAAIFADLDNDGHQDLFLGCFTEENKVYRNRGDGTFEDVSTRTSLGPPLVAVAAAADYDNDGDLDLYLGRYLDPRNHLPTTPFFTRNGENNTLLRNDGDFRFTDVTEVAGVGETGLSLGVIWADYDKDGYQDLYVANDFGRNSLFHNKGDGTFDEVAQKVGAVDLGFGMSATWGDLDNDNDLDIYVANVHSGQRWYGQAATLKNYILTSFKEGTIVEDWGIYRDLYNILGVNWTRAGDHIIKGNSLLLNDGKGNFTDVAVAANANPFGWFWGSTMFDYDNDGLQDLYSANGWVSNTNHDDF